MILLIKKIVVCKKIIFKYIVKICVKVNIGEGGREWIIFLFEVKFEKEVDCWV